MKNRLKLKNLKTTWVEKLLLPKLGLGILNFLTRKSRVFILLVILPFFASGQTTVCPDTYDQFYQAWKKKDTSLVRDFFICKIENYSTDWEFFGNLSDICNQSKFCFGIFDPSEEAWSKMPKKQKEMVIENDKTVYMVYINSCAFMREIDIEKANEIQHKFNLKSRLKKKELECIKIELEQLCK